MALPGSEILSLSGFTFASRAEVRPGSAWRAMLHQRRIRRVETPLVPVCQHLFLDILRPSPVESQDAGLGQAGECFEPEAAIDAVAAIPTVEVLLGVIAIHAEPESVDIGKREEPHPRIRVVAGREGPHHRQRIAGIDIFPNHDDLADAVADVVSPDVGGELVHEFGVTPSGQLVPIVLHAEHEPVTCAFEVLQTIDDRKPLFLEARNIFCATKERYGNIL